MTALRFSLLLVIFFRTAAGQSDHVVAVIEVPVPNAQCSHTLTIRQSDVLKQLALQPNGNPDSYNSADLRIALELVIGQVLLLLAARADAPYFDWSPSDEIVQREIQHITSFFRTPAELEERLRRVGFTSLKDNHFISLMADRWLIGKYVDQRFRSGNAATEEEERTYYDRVFVPEFRRTRPGILIPEFEEVKRQVSITATELKVDSALKRHIERRKRKARITIYEH